MFQSKVALRFLNAVRTNSAAQAAVPLLMPVLDLAAISDKVSIILDMIRPTIQADGGDLELIEVTAEGVARIRLHGACVGCPSSSVTLKQGIERNLRAHCPQIVRVESVEAVDEP